MFDPSLEDTAQYYEDKKYDGSIIKHHRIRHLPRSHVSFDQTENVELVEVEGPPREAMEVEDEEEILEDGTVHKVHKVRRHSLKHIRKSLRSDAGEEDLVEEADVDVPGKQTILETYEEPPKNVSVLEEEEEILDDGTRVKRQVITCSMTQKVRTRAKSFDESGQEISSDEYEIEEVVPGTQSSFLANVSSSSSSSSFIDDLAEMEASIKEEEETYDDGTQVQTTLLQAKETRKSRSRSGSLERTEDTYTVRERRITPSHTPRSGSPVQAVDDETLATLQSVSKSIKTEHFEATVHKTEDKIETTSELQLEQFLPPDALKGLEDDEEEAGKPDTNRNMLH